MSVNSATANGSQLKICFLCYQPILEDYANIFEENIQCLNGECPISDVLSKLLSQELDESEVHSKIICLSCTQNIQEYEESQQLLLQKKSKILGNFNKTLINQEDFVVGLGVGDQNDEAFVDDETAIDDDFDNENVQEIEINEATMLSNHENMKLPEIITENETDCENECKDGSIIGTVNVNEEYFTENSESMIEIIAENDKPFDHLSNDQEEIYVAEITEVKYDEDLIENSEAGNDVENFTNLVQESKKELISKPAYCMNKQNFNCLLCPDTIAEKIEFDANGISAHLRTTHNVRVYICEICSENFKKRSNLTFHLDEVHGGTDGEYCCETCQRVFKNLRLFRIHKRIHLNSTKTFQCHQCDKLYSSKNLLDEHMNMHTGDRPYKCKHCSKDFASKYTLTAHMKIHSNRPRPYKCKTCPKAFYSVQNLQQHERIHTGLKEFICEVCNKCFGTSHNLEVHKIIHTGFKPFMCRTCGKAFARRAEVKDHERIHTGEKPFVCEICQVSFAQRSNLTTHKRATHFNDKRYKCEKCDRSFKRRRLLDYHIRATHTGERPYKCDMCNATFVYPEHYKKHLRIHSGVKPYSCEVCGKAFNSRDNRNAHRFVHSDKKPYECLVCGHGFMRKPLLYNHMKLSGHVNDTIIINQPRICTEKLDAENIQIDNFIEETITDESEIIEEDLVVDGTVSFMEKDIIINEDSENNEDNSMSSQIISDISESFTTEEVIVSNIKTENGDFEILEINEKGGEGIKSEFSWENYVSEEET